MFLLSSIENDKKISCIYLYIKFVFISTFSIISAKQSLAEEIIFNPNALEIDNPSTTIIDLSQFSTKGAQVPGTYRVDIYINGEFQDTCDLTFVRAVNNKLEPQLSPAQLEKWGVRLNSAPKLAEVPKNNNISNLGSYISQSETEFDFSNQVLNISVPQASMNSSAHGSVDPKYWDDGLTSLLLDYNFSGSSSWRDSESGTVDNKFLNLRSGANLGPWRLRNYSTWAYNKSQHNDISNARSDSKWNSISTYVQRNISAIQGQFIAGENYTSSDIFDSVQFKGIQIDSDDSMLPDSLRGFAPTVRGIANSNAQVTVKQNGNIIYQTYVPPGAFTINDLYSTSSSGDLSITIKEANGSERTFIQPFSNVPVMLREGRLKYSFTAGKYRSYNEGGDEPILGQATLAYGFPHDLTGFGGIQSSDNYYAIAAGAGVGLGDVGSISFDATLAHTTIVHKRFGENEASNGQSYRFQYSKDFSATNSTVTLAGYRYSTKGFYTFKEAMDDRDYNDGDYVYSHNNQRSKVQLDLTQNIFDGDWGSLSFSGYQMDYWNKEGFERNISISYSNSIFDGILWSLMYSRTENANLKSDDNQQMVMNVSVPLSEWLSNTYVNNTITNDMRGKTINQIGLYGTALEDNNLSYAFGQGYGNKGYGNSGLISSNYRGTYGVVNAGYNYSDDVHQLNYGVQGSLITHEHGMTFGQPLSGDMSAVALVEAPGADGAKVQSGTGVKTDWRGYTIVPYLSPYKRSRIGLEPASLGENVDLKENVTSVVPTAGAVVRARFKASVGDRVLMNLSNNGHAVPFGAVVSIDGSNNDIAGIVGDGGQVYLSGVPQNGVLTAKWGSDVTKECHANFSLPLQVQEEMENVRSIKQVNLICEG